MRRQRGLASRRVSRSTCMAPVPLAEPPPRKKAGHTFRPPKAAKRCARLFQCTTSCSRPQRFCHNAKSCQVPLFSREKTMIGTINAMKQAPDANPRTNAERQSANKHQSPNRPTTCNRRTPGSSPSKGLKGRPFGYRQIQSPHAWPGLSVLAKAPNCTGIHEGDF